MVMQAPWLHLYPTTPSLLHSSPPQVPWIYQLRRMRYRSLVNSLDNNKHTHERADNNHLSTLVHESNWRLEGSQISIIIRTTRRKMGGAKTQQPISPPLSRVPTTHARHTPSHGIYPHAYTHSSCTLIHTHQYMTTIHYHWIRKQIMDPTVIRVLLILVEVICDHFLDVLYFVLERMCI